MKQSLMTAAALIALSHSCQSWCAETLPDVQTSSQWYTDANALLLQKINATPTTIAAKNVILFVGDGMGVSTLTAARILEGQLNGQSGEEHFLSFERFPYSALVKTYNTNQQTPDSAGTMTAMMTGVKSKAGVISVAENALRADCASSKGYELITALQLAERKGKATGVVSTARITHATPAATYAQTPERNWESDDKLPEEAKTNGCKDIATQLIEFADGDGIDVAMGGGRRHFLPNTVTDLEGSSGKRTDGRNLVAEWQTKYPKGVYVEDLTGFNAIDVSATNKLLGLFNSSHMRYEADRSNDTAGEPSLSEMTATAIDILQKNNNGFVLMVESGRIDHAHHAGNAYNALMDTIEFANAVATAKNKTNENETLILVTADHSHVFTIAGYPTRGNPILGKVVSNDGSGLPRENAALAADDLPYTTLGYTNGLGYADLGSETNADAHYDLESNIGRHDLTSVETTNPGFFQEATIPLSAETHAGEDIALFASGPGAKNVQGVIEQSVIFHIINQSAELGGVTYPSGEKQ